MGAMGVPPVGQQPGWTREQENQVQQEEAAYPTQNGTGSDQDQSLIEMIQEAQKKAQAQRDAMKLPKGNTRYGDAPLEAYARLARARNNCQVNAASGYARRQIFRLKAALRSDSDNAARIKSAINQLQKAVSRCEKKKRDLNRERLAELRKARSEEARKREDLELRRRRSQRMIRESGYLREAEIADRLATQLTAAQMEMRAQAQALGVAASPSAAAQQYAATVSAAAGAEAPAVSSLEGSA